MIPLVALTAEGVGLIFPENIVVRRREVLLVVAGVLANLCAASFRDAVQRIFVFCLIRVFFFFLHCFLISIHWGQDFLPLTLF